MSCGLLLQSKWLKLHLIFSSNTGTACAAIDTIILLQSGSSTEDRAQKPVTCILCKFLAITPCNNALKESRWNIVQDMHFCHFRPLFFESRTYTHQQDLGIVPDIWHKGVLPYRMKMKQQCTICFSVITLDSLDGDDSCIRLRLWCHDVQSNQCPINTSACFPLVTNFGLEPQKKDSTKTQQMQSFFGAKKSLSVDRWLQQLHLYLCQATKRH